MSEETERRGRGQVVRLTDDEHVRQFLAQIFAGLFIAIVLGLGYTWSDTRQNSRDLERHEADISDMKRDVAQTAKDTAVIREILEGKR